MSRYLDFGIDLGTTNSCIARADGDDVRVFQNNDHMNVTPSVVHVLKSGRVLIGRRALNAAATDPANVASEFKRWMGQKDRKEFPSAEKIMSAEQLSAEVLKALREDVRRQLGADVDAAVVTVPAAFGSLQCEATARAASIAGLTEAPLLQEPIAAALGYGTDPKYRDQRLLVFDLGGGTLDIAVVSTRDGRLTILEHRGNNLLGGKDIDRAIVDQLLLPAIEESFRVGDRSERPVEWERMWRRLCLKAEEAKVDLSTATEVIVSLFDLGNDVGDRPIELEVTITRSQLEEVMAPVVDKACVLVTEALEGARLSRDSLDRVLLVGGPTQAPLLRKALSEHLGAEVDYSVDPMTVVARGAAVYATTVERKAAAVPVQSGGNRVRVTLAYDPVCASLECPVAGRTESETGSAAVDVKIDAEGGHWTSGWCPLGDGIFEITVPLREARSTRFFFYARDSSGNLLDTDPEEFSVRHGLVASAPPLPHTISVELMGGRGQSHLDPVFRRNIPLPAQTTVKYRADRTVRPSEPESSLAVKLWEGEVLDDPTANLWVGNLTIDSNDVRRPVPEGSEIELNIEIDQSRLITVSAFVPALNQHFQEQVYVPQRDERDYALMLASIPREVDAQIDRLEEVEAYAEDEKTQEEVDRIRKELEEIDVDLQRADEGRGMEDPDRAKRVVEGVREIRSRLSKLEQRHGIDSREDNDIETAQANCVAAREVAEQFGTSAEKEELRLLSRSLDRSITKDDRRGILRAAKDLESLRWRILFAQDWFWREIFDSMQGSGRAYVNRDEAERWLASGREAVQQGNSDALRKAVQHLWNLQPRTAAEEDQQRALRSGLRRH